MKKLFLKTLCVLLVCMAGNVQADNQFKVSISGGGSVSVGTYVTLTATASGAPLPYGYQWYSSSDGSAWELFASTGGSNSSSNSISVRSTESVTMYYKVKVGSGNLFVTSSSVIVRWYSGSPLAVGNISGGNKTIDGDGCSGYTLSVNPSGGTGSYSYQWQVSSDNSTWLNISGKTSSSYTFYGSDYVGSSDVTKYFRVKVTSGSSTAYASSVYVTIKPKLTVYISSGATSVYTGTNVTLTANPSGGYGTGYNFDWASSTNNSTWSSSIGSSQTYSESQTVSSGSVTKYFRVGAAKGCAHLYSSSVAVTWYSDLKIKNMVGGGSVTYSGGTVGLSVDVAGGNGYFYQWQVSDNNSTWSNVPVGTDPTPAATGRSYSYNAVNTNTGSSNLVKYYRVQITSLGKTITSPTQTVTWRPALVAGTITGGGSYSYGSSVTLTAHPSGGTGSYSYQWQQSTNNSTWTDIANAKSNTYSTIGYNQTVYYRVVISGDNQTKTSSSVSVAWRSALAVGSITGGGGATCSGGSVTLTANPSGGNSSYTYQWQVSDNNSSWSNISGATGKTYSASATNTGGSNITKYYRVTVSGDGQSGTTGSVTVTYRPQLVAGNITGSGSYSYGSNVTLTANPSGGTGGGYSYQWQQSTNNSTWSNIAGAINSTYSAKGYNQTIYYRVTVSGDSQTKTSSSVTVTWRPQLAAGSITGGGTGFISGANVTLTANPSGGTGSGYTYQWLQSSDNAAWSNVSGETGKTITVSGSNETKYYRVIVTGDGQTQTSTSVSATWGEALVAGSISGATSTYTGNSVTLIVSPASGGNHTYSYQWQVYDGSQWSNIGGENSFTYSETNNNTSGVDLQKRYRVKVTDGSQTAYADEVTVTWRAALVAGNITGGTTTYSGNSVTLTSNPLGGDGNYTYQWQTSEDNTGWLDIPGATFNQLVETGDNETDAPISTYYRVLVSGDHQNGISEVACVTRRPSLKISSIRSVGNSIVYGGDDVNLTVDATGGDGTYSYQWYRKDAESDWTPVGGNSAFFTDNHDNYTDATISYQYKVVVSGDSQEKTSAEFQCSWVAFMSIRSMMYAGEKLSYGTNTSISIIMANGSGIYDYQWQTLVNGEWQNIPDNDNPVYTFAITEAGDYRCVVTDSLYSTKSVTSDVVSLDVWPDLIPGTTPTTSYTVDNDSITIGGGTPSGGNGTYHYRWEKRTGNGEFVPMPDTTPTIDVLPDCNTTYRRYDISGDQEKLAFEIQVNVPLKSGAIGVDGLAEFYYAGQQLPILENKTEASGGNVGGSARYQWYSKGEGDNDFTPIDGATYADYRPAGLSETTSFYRAIVDGDDVQNSNVIELNIRIPVIELANLKERYCRDDAVSISVSGVENGVYVWFDGSGNQIGEGAELKLESISESTTLTLETYINTDELLNEKSVALAVVDMTPDFSSDQIIVDAGDVVHFSNSGTDYAQCEWDFGDGADGSFESEPWHYYNHRGTFDVKLRLTSSEGCQDEITKAGAITVNEAVSTDVEADKAGSVSVYPNPVTDWLTVEADGEFVVTITNNLGSVVFKSTASTNLRIDMTNYPEGIYTVGVVDGAGNAHFEQIVKY